MAKVEWILASGSPRRKELMQDLKLPFTILPAECEEIFDPSRSIVEAIENIAFQKAEAVFRKRPEACVIGCDTMVVIDDQALGKPKDEADARRMLLQLSGKTHRVISGVALLSSTQCRCFHEETKVTFYPLDDELVSYYLSSEEPYDKAGAYGIQGMGKLLVERIEGDYYNVVGLPVARLYRELQKFLKK